MAFANIRPTADAEDVQQIIDALTGVSGAGQAISLTQLNDSSNYALDVRNLDTTNGYGLRVRDGASANLLLVYKNNVTLGATASDSIVSNGKTYIGDTANGGMTLGLTINQADNDNEILALKSSDVAHGMTTIAETDTYALFQKRHATGGGLLIRAFSDGDEATTNRSAFYLRGTLGQAADTTKSSSGVGILGLSANVKNGTGETTAGADANLLHIASSTTTVFIFDAEGSGHAEVEWTTYDKYNDLALIADIESELLSREDEAQTERRHALEQAGIIGKESWRFVDGRQRAMVNFTKLAMLHHGALIQVGEKLGSIIGRLELAEQRLAALPGVA